MIKLIKHKKRIFTLMILIFLLGIILAGYFIYKSNGINTSEITQSYPTKEPDGLTYESEYFSARLDNGWEIKEYKDTSLLQGLLGSSYTGNLGIVITKDNNEVFSLKPRTLQGGNNTCSEIYKFSDTDQEFVNQQIKEFKQFSNPDFSPQVIEIQDHTSTFRFFGAEVRLSENKLFYNKSDYRTYSFNPECGDISKKVLTLQGPFYSYIDMYGYNIAFSNQYEFFVKEGIINADIETLVRILQSLEYKGNSLGFNKESCKSIHSEFIKENNVTDSSSYAITDSYLSYLCTFNFRRNNMSFSISLVRSDRFDNSRQLFEKITLNSCQTCFPVAFNSYEKDGLEIFMTIMALAVGPETYALHGGIKDGDRGYYFRFFLGRADLENIREDIFQDILSFSSNLNDEENLKILQSIILKKYSLEAFSQFDRLRVNQATVDRFKRDTDGRYPATFDSIDL